MFRKIYKVLDLIRSSMIVVLMSGIIILCVSQIVLRYFTPANLRPVSWGDEVVRLTAIWIVFLAASIGVKKNSHLSVEFFLHKILGPKQIMVAKKTAIVIVLAVLCAVMVQGIKYAGGSSKAMLQNLPQVSMAWFYAAIPVGCFYLIVEYLRKLFDRSE